MSIVNAVEVREINEPVIQYDEKTDKVIYEAHDGVQLTPEEIAFVEYYCGEAHFSANKAYSLLKGGKSITNRSVGPRWMTKPHIQKAVRWRLDAAGGTRAEMLAELKDVAMAEWRDFVDIKMAGDEIVAVKFDPTAKVRALEIYLRALGELDNKQSINIPIQVNINTNIPEEDLA